MAKVLVIGSGGREHGLVEALSRCSEVDTIYCAPGNAGTAQEPRAENVDIGAENISGLSTFAVMNKVDLAVAGPEAPLCDGIQDHFDGVGVKLFGPTKLAAELEGSKVFCKELLLRNKIPTGRAVVAYDAESAKHFMSGQAGTVFKADGLAAGKGVYLPHTFSEAEAAIKEIMIDRKYGDSGNALLLEEMLFGEEATVLGVTDGKTFLPLPPSQDHKRAYDDDQGPNTGGMGAYAPTGAVDQAMMNRIIEEIIHPTLKAMRDKGRPYVGFLYAGLMLTEKGPKVLEYNIRMGDPETQPVLSLFQGNLYQLMMSALDGKLADCSIENSDESAVCVVMASEGYPGPYKKGALITGIAEAERIEGVKVYHAGTARQGDNIFTSGGRVLGVNAKAPNFAVARERAYEAVGKINFVAPEGAEIPELYEAQFRSDIGKDEAKRGK
jgi:phosphoribosylamine--glycine ligase